MIQENKSKFHFPNEEKKNHNCGINSTLNIFDCLLFLDSTIEKPEARVKIAPQNVNKTHNVTVMFARTGSQSL